MLLFHDVASVAMISTLCLSTLFFSILYLIIIENGFRMFFKRRHGRTHALLGLAHLCLLTLSFCEAFLFPQGAMGQLLLDCLVGGSGSLLAYSAAEDFGHKNIKNIASGTLDDHATVTYAEMLEHVFYQLVNLAQIIYLHSVSSDLALGTRLVLAALVAAVWLLRGLFPVNSFSANYSGQQLDPRSSDSIRLLYRLKKYQYVFYKHFLLHGLNASVAITGVSLASDGQFRVYWLLLNTSYVMEFFLQTLVKKGHLQQARLLQLQRVLMLASSIAALHALRHVNLLLAASSLVLNFVHRHHEVANCWFLLLVAGGYYCTA